MSRAWPVAAGLLLAAGSAPAQGQQLLLEHGIGFSLKPRSSLTADARASAPAARSPSRIVPVPWVDMDDRDQRIAIGVQRQTRRFVNDALPLPGVLPLAAQSRFTRYAVTSHVPVAEQVIATFGWRGMKLSNRHANVTAGAGGDRLRARDFFLPAAALRIAPGSGITLTIDYAEAMRAYGGAGFDGPLGLTDAAWRDLRRTLGPETQGRARATADWTVTPGTALSVSLLSGRLNDRLGFAPDTRLPVNGGSAGVVGAVMLARQQVTPQFGLTLRYGAARLRPDAGGKESERSLSLGGEWLDGPLRASATVSRGSAPALVRLAYRPMRVEASLDYAGLALAGRPLRLGLRLADPDPMASSRFASDEAALSLRPADQARALLATARLDW